ncbi:hypothetical protein FS749_012724, partial [Ceratobasidium sp. UAMH 11750]
MSCTGSAFLKPQAFSAVQISVALSRNRQNLQDFGIAGSSSQLSSEDVFEYFALQVAKDRWPNHIISDQYLRKPITPQSHGYIPHHATVTRDIKIMYNMTQAEMIVQLA